MSLQSQTQGTSFGRVGKLPAVLSQPEIAELWIALGGSPKTADLASAVSMAESGGNTKSVSNPCCKGMWQINVEVGNSSLAQALDPKWATTWTIKESKNGTDWGQWEAYTDGSYKTYLGKSGKHIGAILHPGTQTNLSGIPGLEQAEEGVNAVTGGIASAEDFLSEAFSYLTNFRKLGQLAAEAVAWFIRLLAKAIWDYVVAPLGHWSERAVSFYWVNYFGTGSEKGSGFGYRLRENAATITVLFWGIGYAVLWSDGTGTKMVSADESLMGQGIKGIEGAIARRNLVKPKDVKKKTPTKPKPKSSTVPIERQETYSVARKRPVSVTNQHGEGRSHNGRSRGQRQQAAFKPSPIPRPGQKESAGKKLVIAKGYSRRAQKPPPKKPAKTAKQSKPRVGA